MSHAKHSESVGMAENNPKLTCEAQANTILKEKVISIISMFKNKEKEVKSL